jgi:electron transfer flavoprotein alpha/beta subunit
VTPRVFALVDGPGDLDVVRHAVALGDTTVVTAAEGPLAEAVLADALALGARAAVRVWDEVLARADFLGVAQALAATVRQHMGEPSPAAPAPTETAAPGATATPTAAVIVIAGDRGRAAVGPAVAERLSLPHLGQVMRISLRDGRVVVRRRAGGIVHLFAARPPILLCTVGSPTDAPPAPAASAPAAIQSLTLADVGLSATELSHRRRFRPQPGAAPEARPRVVPSIETLVARLDDEGLLRPKGAR